jgi:hypothetical protein
MEGMHLNFLMIFSSSLGEDGGCENPTETVWYHQTCWKVSIIFVLLIVIMIFKTRD